MKKRICKDMPGRCKHINVGRLLFLSFLCVTLTACFSLNACAADVSLTPIAIGVKIGVKPKKLKRHYKNNCTLVK